jgi:GR25 family glycosyltransferase involved in LPS biosynthesis
MRIICISIHDVPKEQAHFTARGIEPQVFHGIHGPRLRLHSTGPFESMRTGYPVAASVGCGLSHRALWAACLLLPDEEFFILEEDANFQRNWRKRLDQARQHLPSDWDVLFVGSCHAAGKASKHISGDLFEFTPAVPAAHNGLLGGFASRDLYGYPLCCHALMLRRKALMPLIRALDARELRQPIDIALAAYGLERLRVFGILPRIAAQWGHVLPE